ncbi:MAG: carbohydrate kinase family protein [Halanaeroarchaeum sp.]
MVRVITAGHVNWDVTLGVDALPDPDGEARISSQRLSGGGSAANVAVAIVGYGADAAVVGSVGDDEPGFLARRELDLAGVDVSALRTIRGRDTTVKYLVVDDAGQVMVLGNEGANEAFGADEIDREALGTADHLHLTSQRPETARALAKKARAGGTAVSFDPGRRIGERDYGDLLETVDVLLVNRREAAIALDGGDPREAVAGTDRILAVKRGAEGAAVYAADAVLEHPGFAVETVDTTGAGDAFAAGFLAVFVGALNGRDRSPRRAPDLERALEVGNAAGALSTRGVGARTAPDRETLESFLAERADAE